MRHFSISAALIAFLTVAAGLSAPALSAFAADLGLDINPALPVIPHHDFNLKDFGGIGDGKTWNTEAFHKAIAQIDQQGGGRLIVPAGVYLTRPFVLCSRLDLHLEEGAVIQGPATFTDYGVVEPTTLKTQADVAANVKTPDPLISGRNLQDLAITGSGTIDGSGAIWWAWSEKAARLQPGHLIYPRPRMVVISGCKRLHMEGITLRNSPQFHFVPRDVQDLLIEHVKVKTPSDAPNTDAIDPASCTNVLIRDCDIDTGDDDIAIKSGGHNILIQDCTIRHGHGISIGSETTGGVSDMLVRRCTFTQSDNGIRIKSMRGAGGLVENIRYTDIQMTAVANAIVLDLTYMDANRPNFRGDPLKIPRMRNILIDHVKITGSINAGKIVGLPDSPITDVTLRDVQIAADHDLIVKDAQRVSFELVTRNIHGTTRSD